MPRHRILSVCDGISDHGDYYRVGTWEVLDFAGRALAYLTAAPGNRGLSACGAEAVAHMPMNERPRLGQDAGFPTRKHGPGVAAILETPVLSVCYPAGCLGEGRQVYGEVRDASNRPRNIGAASGVRVRIRCVFSQPSRGGRRSWINSSRFRKARNLLPAARPARSIQVSSRRSRSPRSRRLPENGYGTLIVWGYRRRKAEGRRGSIQPIDGASSRPTPAARPLENSDDAAYCADGFFRQPSVHIFRKLCKSARNANVEPAVEAWARYFLETGHFP